MPKIIPLEKDLNCIHLPFLTSEVFTVHFLPVPSLFDNQTPHRCPPLECPGSTSWLPSVHLSLVDCLVNCSLVSEHCPLMFDLCSPVDFQCQLSDYPIITCSPLTVYWLLTCCRALSTPWLPGDHLGVRRKRERGALLCRSLNADWETICENIFHTLHHHTGAHWSLLGIFSRRRLVVRSCPRLGGLSEYRWGVDTNCHEGFTTNNIGPTTQGKFENIHEQSGLLWQFRFWHRGTSPCMDNICKIRTPTQTWMIEVMISKLHSTPGFM